MNLVSKPTLASAGIKSQMEKDKERAIALLQKILDSQTVTDYGKTNRKFTGII